MGFFHENRLRIWPLSQQTRQGRALSADDVPSLMDNEWLNKDEVEGALEAVCQYDKHLTDIPVEGWSLADIYHIRKQKTVFDVDVPLWTVEAGRSDLMLQIRVDHGTVKIMDIQVP